jgi:hypothetical protein
MQPQRGLNTNSASKIFRALRQNDHETQARVLQHQHAEFGTCDHPVPADNFSAERTLDPKLDPNPKTGYLAKSPKTTDLQGSSDREDRFKVADIPMFTGVSSRRSPRIPLLRSSPAPLIPLTGVMFGP